MVKLGPVGARFSGCVTDVKPFEFKYKNTTLWALNNDAVDLERSLGKAAAEAGKYRERGPLALEFDQKQRSLGRLYERLSGKKLD